MISSRSSGGIFGRNALFGSLLLFGESAALCSTGFVSWEDGTTLSGGALSDLCRLLLVLSLSGDGLLGSMTGFR